VRLDFRLHDASGSVEVAVEPNRNPESLAKPPFAKDCPVCTATVTYAGEGYKAAIGRVQLVRSTDGAGASKEFEMDPFEPLGPSAHPFCFFGLRRFSSTPRPVHPVRIWIGAPRASCVSSQWTTRVRRVRSSDFSWGFTIRSKQVSLTPPRRLSAAEWDKHRPLLRREHPAWSFATGYRSG
jgi:hypothetical protein